MTRWLAVVALGAVVGLGGCGGEPAAPPPPKVEKAKGKKGGKAKGGKAKGQKAKGKAKSEDAAEALPAAPEGRKTSFITPKHGDTVTSPLTITFGVEGMEVAPAGFAFPNKGHHHLFIDAENFLKKGDPIPADDKHIHYGKGDKTVTVELSPGQHKLTTQFADGLHKSYGKEYATWIIVNVE